MPYGREEGGGGSGTQKFVYQKRPDKIFPIVNFSHHRHFGLEGRGGGGFPEGAPPGRRKKFMHVPGGQQVLSRGIGKAPRLISGPAISRTIGRSREGEP